MTPILVNGKVVGQVENGVFSKTVEASKHFLQKPPAICFDLASLDTAQNLGATRVVVKDKETGKIYQSSISYIQFHGFTLNRGYGAQIALSLDRWMKHNDEQLVLIPEVINEP